MCIQSPFEEKLNAISHGFGALFGILALVLLVTSDTGKSEYSLFSVLVYSFSIILLFTASTLYHAVRREKYKHYFRILDHTLLY